MGTNYIWIILISQTLILPSISETVCNPKLCNCNEELTECISCLSTDLLPLYLPHHTTLAPTWVLCAMSCDPSTMISFTSPTSHSKLCYYRSCPLVSITPHTYFFILKESLQESGGKEIKGFRCGEYECPALAQYVYEEGVANLTMCGVSASEWKILDYAPHLYSSPILFILLIIIRSSL